MMEVVKFFLFASLSYLILLVAHSNQQKTLTDLRRFKAEGVAARFAVDRTILKRELENRKLQDTACDQAVELHLPQSLPHTSYDTSLQGEVTLTDISITDHTLAAELPNELKEEVATSYRLFGVVIPVVFGMTEKHGLLTGYILINTTKKVFPPYLTNYKNITQVDIIEEKDDGTVKIQLGDDVMAYQLKHEVKCKGAKKLGKDFEEVLGEIETTTNYPLSFDWGCNILGIQIRFCQAVNEVRYELGAVGGDVCSLTSTSSSQRCPTTLTIVNMTGIFRDMFPFLAETVLVESFEAEFGETEHTTGITFPCLTR